jgi:hypothetical protein
MEDERRTNEEYCYSLTSYLKGSVGILDPIIIIFDEMSLKVELISPVVAVDLRRNNLKQQS